jgi:death-on-curing protein
MAGNHGFADGNKRTTLLLVDALIERSGFDLCPLNDSESINDAVEEMILAVAGGKMRFDAIAVWFTGRIRRVT